MISDWASCELGDVADFQRGLTYDKADEVEISQNVVLRATNIDLDTNLLDLSELRYISETVSIPEAKRVREGALIICTASGSKSHLGKVALIDQPYGFAFGGFMGLLTPRPELLPKFLFLLMTSPFYKEFIARLSDGTNINNLKFDDLKRFKVPLPPLPEQQRIVRIMDEAFEAIAAARANTQKNLENACGLFERELELVFSQPRNGWLQKQIGDVCILRSGTTLDPKVEKATGEIPYLKVADMNLGENRSGVIHSSRYVSGSDVNASNILPTGTTIFPKRGGAILTNKKRLTKRPICADLNIMGVTPRGGLLPEFVFHYFLNLDLRKINNGSSIPQINNYNIEPLLISFPRALEHQDEIIKRLSRVSEETKNLSAVYQRKLDALDELKRSLLHQAFTGAL